MKVQFSTQPDVVVLLPPDPMSMGNSELAYALTVHKSQGSDFDIVFLYPAEDASTLSRELLYTGLTRFRQKMVLLIERTRRSSKSSAVRSVRTPCCGTRNLFVLAVRPESVDRYYAEHLIHRTRLGATSERFWSAQVRGHRGR